MEDIHIDLTGRPKRHLKNNYCSFVSVPIPPLTYRFYAGQTDKLVKLQVVFVDFIYQHKPTKTCIKAP